MHGLTHGHDIGQDFHGLGLGQGIGNHENVVHGHLGYGAEDIGHHVENLEEDVQPVMVHNHHHHNHVHNHDFEPNFKFHYPTYEIPVHGDVVSEKDAKKIGELYSWFTKCFTRDITLNIFIIF